MPDYVVKNFINDFIKSDSLSAAHANLNLGSAALSSGDSFDVSGLAASAQEFSIQREHHTGTQLVSSLSDPENLPVSIAVSSVLNDIADLSYPTQLTLIADGLATQTPGAENGFGTVARLSSGRIVTVWRRASDHAFGGTVVAAYSDDLGRSWSDRVEIYNVAANDARDPGVAVVDDNGTETLLLSFSVETPNGANTYVGYTATSIDGETWTTPAVLAVAEDLYVTGKPFDCGGGRWIIPSYRSGTARLHITDDYGANWSTSVLDADINEMGIVRDTDGSTLWIVARLDDNTGYRVYSSDDDGASWTEKSASFGGGITISAGARPNIIHDGGQYLMPYRSPGGVNVGLMSIMVSEDMLTWRHAFTVPESLCSVFAYADFISLPAREIGLVFGAGFGNPFVRWYWSTISHLRDLAYPEAITSGVVARLPFLTPTAPRMLSETFATQDATAVASGQIGQWGWNFSAAGGGTVAYGNATFRPMGRSVQLTTGSTANNYVILVQPTTVASATDASCAVTFQVALPSWADISLRCGYMGTNTPLASGTPGRYVVFDSAVDTSWRYHSEVNAGGSGTVDEVLATALTTATNRLFSITICPPLYNEKVLGGQSGKSRIIISQVNVSGIGAAVCDVEVADPGTLYNSRIFLAAHTRTAAAKTINIYGVDLSQAFIYALSDGVAF